jgi:hypothetical protein
MFVWFWVVARWFPLREGRDMMNYFLCFRDMLQIEPEFPLLMLFRTPLTPLFYGTCFEFLEVTGIELVLALLYAGSIIFVFAVVREFSIFGAWTLNALLGVNLWLFRWFNAVGSETLQTVLLCLWFSFTFFAMRSAKLLVWVGVGDRLSAGSQSSGKPNVRAMLSASALYRKRACQAPSRAFRVFSDHLCGDACGILLA